MNTNKKTIEHVFDYCTHFVRVHGHGMAAGFLSLVAGILFMTQSATFEASRITADLVGDSSAFIVSSEAAPKIIETETGASVSSSVTPVTIEANSSASSVQIKVPAPQKSSSIASVSSQTSLRPAAPESGPSASSTSSTPDRTRGGVLLSPNEGVLPSNETPASSASSVSSAPRISRSAFPAFDHASFPVAEVPNWGAMRSPTEWNRTYKEMTAVDFVNIPRYDLGKLTIPMDELTKPLRDENIPIITAKLFYSTRFFGAYDLDAGEWTGMHGGIDLKLPQGTPIGAIGGGRVSAVRQTDTLGLHVIIEHRLLNGETYYSIYGHLGSAAVRAGESIEPGQYIGNVGMTGNTTAPHLHLQIDKGIPGEDHTPYMTRSIPSPGDAALHVVNPVTFISTHRTGQH